MNVVVTTGLKLVCGQEEQAGTVVTGMNVVCTTARCNGAKPDTWTAGAVATAAVGAKPTVQGVVATGAATTVGAATTGMATPQRRIRQRSNNPTRGCTTTGAGATATGAKATAGVGHVAHCARASLALTNAIVAHIAADSAAARRDKWVMFGFSLVGNAEVIPLPLV